MICSKINLQLESFPYINSVINVSIKSHDIINACFRTTVTLL